MCSHDTSSDLKEATVAAHLRRVQRPFPTSPPFYSENDPSQAENIQDSSAGLI